MIFDTVKDEMSLVTPVRPDRRRVGGKGLQGALQAPEGGDRGS